MSTNGPQGEEFSSYIKATLEAEYKRRDDFNARAASTITSSGGMITLTVAVFAIFLGRDFRLGGAERNWMIVAFFLFLACAALGVAAGIGWKYKVTNEQTLRQMITSYWRITEVSARNAVADENIKAIVGLRKGNGIKYKILLSASITQAFAIAALALSAIYALT